MKPGKYFKSTLTMLIVAVALLLTTSAALATEGNLNYDATGTDINGIADEWDTDVNGLDFYAPMYRAGVVDEERITGHLYLRYDCATGTMYAYVKSAGFKINTAIDDESFINIDGSKVVDASYATFAYVNEVNERADGWEASFALTPGPHTILAHNIFVDGVATDETSSTPKSPPIPVSPDCSCTGATITATVCLDVNENSVCDDGESRFPGLNLPVTLVPDSPTPTNPILIGGTAFTGQVTFESSRDGYEVPGDYSVQINDAYLLAQGYHPTTATSYSFSIATCATVEREFGYNLTALGTVGDLVWYDNDSDGLQDEWFDADGDEKVTPFPVGHPIPLSDFEWIDVNGDGKYGTVLEDGSLNDVGQEGELNRCAIPGVEASLNSPAQTTLTNILGYYHFYNLPLGNLTNDIKTYTTSISPGNAALNAGAEAWFDLNQASLADPADDLVAVCASDIPSDSPDVTAFVAAASVRSQPVEASALQATTCGLTTDSGIESDPLTAADPEDITLDFAINCTDGPLAVTLSNFEAERDGNGVSLVWETATESGVAGFNVYAETDDGLVQVNETLIASPVIDSVTPTTYGYEAEIGGSQLYLELISINGGREMFGPFAITGSGAVPQFDPDMSVWIPLIAR